MYTYVFESAVNMTTLPLSLYFNGATNWVSSTEIDIAGSYGYSSRLIGVNFVGGQSVGTVNSMDVRCSAAQGLFTASNLTIAVSDLFSARANSAALNNLLFGSGASITGSAFADVLQGGAGDDLLFGGDGNDTLNGVGGNDTIFGQNGADTLSGGAGTNILDGGPGGDTLDGTGGTSTASYQDATAGVTASLLNTAGNTGDAAGDSYINIHNLTGSAFNDILAGDNAGDVIDGGAGDDTLTGGSGADTLIGGAGTNLLDGGGGGDRLDGTGGVSTASYQDAGAGVTASLLSPATNAGDAAGDSYINIHNLTGSAFNDVLVGDNAGDVLSGGAGDDVLTGGTGNDTLNGGAGNDTLKGGGGVDLLDGGAGADHFDGTGGTATVTYQDAAAGVTANLLNPAANTGDGAGDTYVNIHTVVGSAFNDTLTADNAGDTLMGGAGADTLTGGGGSDTLFGGAGDDTLVSGSGTEVLVGDAGADHLVGTAGAAFASYQDSGSGLTVNLLNPTLNTGDAAGDTYVNIHRLIGSTFADTLVADNAGDNIFGGAGNDTITGGAGADVLSGGAGDDTLAGGSGADMLAGGAGNDTLTGGAAVNILDGGAGADKLDGTGGVSTASYADATAGVTANLLNPAANTGDAAGDSYVAIHALAGSNFNDVLVADNAGDVLAGGAGGDTLTGGTGNDTLQGGAGNDTLTGGAGVNVLDGGAGADKLDGTGGTSTASYLDATAGVTANLFNPAANTGDAAGDTYVNIHRVQGSNFADTLVADNAGDLLIGGGGADVLTGGTGNDTLQGGAGNDTLNGGAGLNVLDGGAGADHLDGTGGTATASYQDAATGVKASLLNPTTNTGDATGDSYVNIHRLQGSSFSDTLTADNAGDRLSGGGGDDTLIGGTGADVLLGGAGANTLIGAGGSDTLAGGPGNNTFLFQTITDSSAAAPDRITDFHSGDLIDVSEIDADAGASGHQSFVLSSTPGVGHIVVAYNAAANTTVVSLYDNNSGVADGKIRLTGNIALTAADFILAPHAALSPAGGLGAARHARMVSAMAGFGASSAALAAVGPAHGLATVPAMVSAPHPAFGA
jgi:Ca2+-binding RTX toxin-like protein